MKPEINSINSIIGRLTVLVDPVFIVSVILLVLTLAMTSWVMEVDNRLRKETLTRVLLEYSLKEKEKEVQALKHRLNADPAQP